MTAKKPPPICGLTTVRGKVCQQPPANMLQGPPAGPFPCCPNHVGHWCVDSRARTLAVVRHYAGRITRVWPRCGQTCGRAEVRDAPEVEIAVKLGRSGHDTAVRLWLDTATVAADLLATLGDHGTSERILAAVDRARAEWPARQMHLGGCRVFGCGNREIAPRLGRCAKHTDAGRTHLS